MSLAVYSRALSLSARSTNKGAGAEVWSGEARRSAARRGVSEHTKVAAGFGCGSGALLAAATLAAPPEDGKAAFERREDKMKHMGRPLYLGIRRLVKGTAAYGPDTGAAAETVASRAGTLDRTLFPTGSDVDGSKIKPKIFAASDHVTS